MKMGATRVGRGRRSFVRFGSLLAAAELRRARAWLSSPPLQALLSPADLFHHAANSSRSARVAWVERRGEARAPPWLFAKLRRAARQAVAMLGDRSVGVGTDCRGFWTPRFEPLQYSEYAKGGHYAGWHTDAEWPEEDPEDARCLTLVLLLSPTSEFKGCVSPLAQSLTLREDALVHIEPSSRRSSRLLSLIIQPCRSLTLLLLARTSQCKG